jgi:ribokinase
MVDVVGFGALNFDRLFKVEKIAESGTEVNVIDEKGSPGGSAANTIYGLAKLGVDCGFVGAAGDDSEGKSILNDFKEVGVDTSRIRVVDEPRTGIVIGFVDDKGERALYVSPGANSKIRKEDVDMDYLGSSKIVHMSSFVDQKQFEIQKETCESLAGQVKISICPGALYARRGMSQLNPILGCSDIVFLNRKETEELTGKDYVEGSKDLLELTQGIVAVTLGDEGCYVIDKEGEYTVPSAPKEAVDTTGAGDSFATGFLYGILLNKNPEQCGKIGNIVASKSIESIGARTCLPTVEEIQSSTDFPK